MTPLARILADRIKAKGPISLSDYMADCLMHPDHGYYTNRQPFGLEGDFITSPEISQMFGELIGICLGQAWLDAGSPSPFILAELGPGRGVLMADLLRATKKIPGFLDAARISMVESSPRLREKQRATLTGYQVHWYDTFADLPAGPLYLVANEFFDALPIRQFERVRGGWRELMVDFADGAFFYDWSPVCLVPDLAPRLINTTPGEIVELCAPANVVAAQLGARIATTGGVAIAIDYGGWVSRGDTFQAMKAHDSTPPLDEPGLADLTAHVDFAALAAAAAPAEFLYTSQGAFLTELGIAHRSEALARRLTGEALDNHLNATWRLTDGAEMGTLFKVLALTKKGDPPPPGF
jgi:SAM-dependent MidA family methyltransferase